MRCRRDPRGNAPSAMDPAGNASSASPVGGISTLSGEIREETPRVRGRRENLDPRFRARGGLTCGFAKQPSNRRSRKGVPPAHSGSLPTDSVGFGGDFAADFALGTLPDGLVGLAAECGSMASPRQCYGQPGQPRHRTSVASSEAMLHLTAGLSWTGAVVAFRGFASAMRRSSGAVSSVSSPSASALRAAWPITEASLRCPSRRRSRNRHRRARPP